MRLQSLQLASYKNLRDFRCEFGDGGMVTVLLGGNGTGKSNLIEALVVIFRDLDLGDPPSFSYFLKYESRDHMIEITAIEASRKDTVIRVDGDEVSFAKFTAEMGREWRPSHVFGYYSGTSGRLEALFSKHQERFYRALIDPKPSAPENESSGSSPLRPLFYARPVHSQFVLLSFFCRHDERQREILNNVLGIERLESVLFVLREPPWASKRPNATVREHGDDRFWYARGVVKEFLGKLYELALAPIRLVT